ncbi:hypothetical protein [Streptomyces sp. CB03911]|uniref:hypothetical protein n=1 Tax=Streptomyces sp. CB03911 TaxID=1804758 RepID=UPI00093E5789|nr:hypothetical protein [Streptomyces sp. CB03911]OKI17568.1 hypothetical protein A6A07_39725 [Streptomyces sp. CB03911]
MTDSHTPASALLRRLPLIGLYPAEYRAAHGEEIAAVLAETVRHAGRRDALREWAALAAHALRLRTRLSSRDPAGRILAGAAPFLLAGGAALSVVHLLTGLLLPESSRDFARAAAGAAQTAPWVLALLCLTLGLRAPARGLVLLAVVSRIGVAAAAQFHPDSALTQDADLFWLWVVMGVVVLIAPPDAVDGSPRGRSWTMASAVAVALPMSGLAVLWLGTWPEDYGNVIFPSSVQSVLDASTVWPASVMTLAYLLHLGSPDTDPLRAGGVALAVLPWTVMVAPPLYRSAPTDHHDLLRNGGAVLALLAVATIVGTLRRSARRTRTRPGASDPTP